MIQKLLFNFGSVTMFMFCVNILFAQSPSNINLKSVVEKDNKLYITYDITDNLPEEVFEVGINATKKDGTKISYSNATGDIGKNMKAGTDKEIVWDLVSDEIFLKEKITVKLTGTVTTDFNYFSYKKLLVSSIVLPGLGRHKLDRSKKQYIIGALGYACIFNSLLFKSMANKNYDLYLNETNPVTRNEYYSNVSTGNTIFAVSLISAATIWASDQVILLLKKKSNQSTASNFENNINIGVSYNYLTQKPLIGVNYRF